MYRVINHISALRCTGHLQPFTYEWVKSGYVLSLTGQACKIKKTSLKEKTGCTGIVTQSVFLMLKPLKSFY